MAHNESLISAAILPAGLDSKVSEGFIFDKKTGLTAYVLQNTRISPPEIRIVFGGTTSGTSPGDMNKRILQNALFTLRQWLANGRNTLFGQIPKCFRQASVLTNCIQQTMLDDLGYSGYILKVSGHSKGGAETAFAALTQNPPLSAICFSSAELGRQAHSAIPEANKKSR